ncbi:uncharacterized protein N7482_003096 [Penicillium canariense]|uniref:Transcription factor IIIC, subunit 5 n=1 Tax=Penicillium canariense TaxID=189055 RepID=A0A9W9IGP0_9EURO|nr:uncharacterized protein N7482_003096 [Penicillium canariense]KAJ5177219.1 hypothetical protein N7482_003096 [Penicillium canariense]
METHRESRTASFYHVPARHLVSVEHPAVIRNLEKAVSTLQGNTGIERILNPAKADTSANLMLRPEDAMSRPIQSTSCPSNNVLLKITVPKRTGRKRKRGTDEPFTDATPESTGEPLRRRTAKDTMRSLSDNPSNYRVEAVGRVGRTHVFRGMPDFVYSTMNSAFTNRFREQILPYELEKIKQFDLDMRKGALLNADLIPPPSFSQGEVPFQYIYRQNPTVKTAVGQSGEVTTVNTQQPTRVRTHLVAYDIPEVPSKPQESLRPIETLDNGLRSLIKVLEELFEKRPAWTRRALRNHLTTDEQRNLLRHAVPYIGYIFRSGPWRDAIIRLGHDPRTSPEYRHYQTFMFRILPREPELARDGGGGRRHNIPRPITEDPSQGNGLSDSHIFTGELPLPRDGRIWMACDIQDPVLAEVLYPADPDPTFLRPACEIITDGWFGNGTLAKVKTIMRFKIQSLIEDRAPHNSDFRRIVAFPDHAYTEADLGLFTVPLESSISREISMATEVRASIKGAPLWRKMHDRGQGDLDGEKVQRQKQGRTRGKGKKTKVVAFEMEEEEEEGDGDGDGGGEESEGEEEEMERVEMWEEQAAAAVAAREAALAEEDENENDEGEAEGDEMEGDE